MISDAKPGMNGRRIGKIREIEAEFGEPFWDVVRGFAEMGYGRTATAGILGYSRVGFLRFLWEGPPIDWPDCARGLRRHPEAWLANVQAAGARRARRHFVLGQWRTVREISQAFGVSRAAIDKRLAQGITGDALAAAPMSRSQTGALGAAATNQKGNGKHAWRAA